MKNELCYCVIQPRHFIQQTTKNYADDMTFTGNAMHLIWKMHRTHFSCINTSPCYPEIYVTPVSSYPHYPNCRVFTRLNTIIYFINKFHAIFSLIFHYTSSPFPSLRFFSRFSLFPLSYLDLSFSLPLSLPQSYKFSSFFYRLSH